MALYEVDWTPIVELQTGQAVSDKLDGAFESIDLTFDDIKLVANTHGIDNPNTPILVLNADTTKYDIVPFTAYIQSEKFEYAGSVANISGFGQAGDFIVIGFNGTSIVLKINNTFTSEERKSILEIGRIGSGDGSNITAIGDSAFFSNEYMVNMMIRFKDFDGASFYNGSGQASMNTTTPFTTDIKGGNMNTANMQIQDIDAEVEVAGFPIYAIAGVTKTRPLQDPLIADNTQYDNGTDLVPLSAGYYVTHTLLRSSGTKAYYLQYGRVEYKQLLDAVNSEPTNTYFNLQGLEVEKISMIVVQEGVGEVQQFIDIREDKFKLVGPIATQPESEEFSAISLAVTQEPTVQDVPIQVEFGAAQNNTNASLAADGTITIHTTGEYHLTTLMHFGRSGGAGQAELFTRRLINGVQDIHSHHATLDNSAFVFPSQSFDKIYFVEGDILTYEVMRGSGGTNEGGLFEYNPNVAGWADAPTASITVVKHN